MAAVKKPRTRLVYFRVSEDELQELHRVCEMEGTRSLSDLARTAMKRAVHNAGAGQDSESARLARLEGMVAELSSCLQVLRAMIYDQAETQMLDPKPAVSLGGRANAKSA